MPRKPFKHKLLKIIIKYIYANYILHFFLKHLLSLRNVVKAVQMHRDRNIKLILIKIKTYVQRIAIKKLV